MILHDLPPLSRQRQAHIYATGFLTIITLGTFAVIAAVFAALWLLVQIVSILLQSMIEALTTVGQLYATSDPFIKCILLCAVGAALYYLARRLIRRETR